MKHNISVLPVLLGKDRELSAKVFTAFYRMEKARRMPKRDFGYDHVKKFALIYFKLTPACNLRCKMCGQYGDKGNMLARVEEETRKILPLETWKKVVDEIAPMKPVTYLWGGETLLYPDLFPLARYMVEKGLFVSVNTNGTLIEDRAEEIVRDKWGTVFVSLDAFRDANDSMRGAGTYDKVIAGFRALNREKKRQNSVLPFMGVVSVVTNRNYLDLANLSDALEEHDLDFHVINMGTYTNDRIVEAQKRVMREKLGTDIDCLAGYNTGYNAGIDGSAFNRVLRAIWDKKRKHTTIAAPALNPEKADVYYGDLETPVRNRCPVPWCQANVNYNGDVHFCADYPDYILGNVAREPFFDIINGERANKFRREINACEGGMFPGCLRCYQNMLFGNKIKGF